LNISRYEQRVLHALAQGGAILHTRDPETGRIVEVDCVTRDGYRLVDCTLGVFARLRRRRLIESRNGGPYRISRFGVGCVRAQLDNR
jgi:uncharacterized protein YjhX (UPF0386 family)